MKTLLSTLAIIILNNLLCQESIYFNIAIQPNSEYIEKTTLNSKSIVETESLHQNFSLDQMKIPKTKESSSYIIQLAHIRSFNRDSLKQQEFPIQIEYIYYEKDNNSNLIPSGTTLHARSVKKGIYQIDSVSGNNLIPSMKKELINSMDNFFKQYCLPSGKAMSVGDIYTYEFTFEQALSELPITATGKTIYKLIDVQNEKAHFTFTTQIEFTQKILNQIDFLDAFDYLDYKSIIDNPNTVFLKNGSSSGNGNLVYNILHKMVETQSSYSTIKMNLENQYFKVTNSQDVDFHIVRETISIEKR